MRRTLLLGLLLGLLSSGTTSGSTTGSGGASGTTSRANVHEKVLDVLALESLKSEVSYRACDGMTLKSIRRGYSFRTLAKMEVQIGSTSSMLAALMRVCSLSAYSSQRLAYRILDIPNRFAGKSAFPTRFMGRILQGHTVISTPSSARISAA
jgi:hypothetical protein